MSGLPGWLNGWMASPYSKCTTWVSTRDVRLQTECCSIFRFALKAFAFWPTMEATSIFARNMANLAPTRHTLLPIHLQMRILLLKVFSTQNVFSYLLSSGVVYTCSPIPNENRVFCFEHKSIRTISAAVRYGGATLVQRTNGERRWGRLWFRLDCSKSPTYV